MKKNHKFIFVIGGVMSGVGKGVTTSSIGMMLQQKGFKVNIVKVLRIKKYSHLIHYIKEFHIMNYSIMIKRINKFMIIL